MLSIKATAASEETNQKKKWPELIVLWRKLPIHVGLSEVSDDKNGLYSLCQEAMESIQSWDAAPRPPSQRRTADHWNKQRANRSSKIELKIRHHHLSEEGRLQRLPEQTQASSTII